MLKTSPGGFDSHLDSDLYQGSLNDTGLYKAKGLTTFIGSSRLRRMVEDRGIGSPWTARDPGIKDRESRYRVLCGAVLAFQVSGAMGHGPDGSRAFRRHSFDPRDKQ